MEEIKPGVFKVIISESDCGKFPCISCQCMESCGLWLWKNSPAIQVKKKKMNICCAIRLGIIDYGDIRKTPIEDKQTRNANKVASMAKGISVPAPVVESKPEEVPPPVPPVVLRELSLDDIDQNMMRFLNGEV